MLKHVMKFLMDMFMGPDGETWAIGRIYSVPLLATGLAAPIFAITKQTVSLSEVGIELGAVAAAIAALVTLTNHVDNPLPAAAK